MKFDSFYSEESIIKILCKYRASAAKKRHDRHMMRNISLHESSNKIEVTAKQDEFIFLQSIFPSRRKWTKLNQRERKSCNGSGEINKQRLFKSYNDIRWRIHNEGLAPPLWYNDLLAFVSEISDEINNVESSGYKFEPPIIKGLKKEIKKGIIIYRPIAKYALKEKIISTVTAKYFTVFFDKIFLDCSYAFRSKNIANIVPNHHQCIEKILDHRKANKLLWVSECDIQKFFDTVQHEHTLIKFKQGAAQIELDFGEIVDKRAVVIFNLFLLSFSFQENILNLNNNPQWFLDNNLEPGEFSWVESELNTQFGNSYVASYAIGIPQGNAISCFIANLILHDVDTKIIKQHPEIFYIRYCDDMILMSSDENTCKDVLDIYMNGIKDNFLLFHNPKQIENYKVAENSRKFWKLKSKLPFLWDDKNLGSKNIPWVSFVGYQVNFNGIIRVRKATIKKEVKKQTAESEKILRFLGKVNHYSKPKNEHSRLSKKQIVFSLHNRLIAMSVGRVKLHNHKNPSKQGMCWTNGFRILSHNKISSKQLRYLDKTRNIQVNRIKNEVKHINKTARTTFDDSNKIFLGCAFSYYNFLKHK